MQTPPAKQVVRLDLSQAQKDLVQHTTGRNGDAIELTVEELEERIAPRISGNHNETLLRDRQA